MREIKFRAWRGKERLDWLTIRQSAFNYQSVSEQRKSNEIFTPLIYDVFTSPLFIVEQFTGLRDKNGKEIYEGDIVKVHPPYGCLGKGGAGFVVFRERIGMFGLDDVDEKRRLKDTFHCDLYPTAEYASFPWNVAAEVIGNIHENPELLGLRCYVGKEAGS